MSSFPDVKKVPIKPEHDFIVVACDGIWDCFTNEQAAKIVRTKREKGPKALKSKSLKNNSNKSPLKVNKQRSEGAKKLKPPGETSFIIEEIMDQGIAKGDITMSDGTGTDNMTCIII